MDLTSLKVSGFRCFGQPTELVFTSRNGLSLVRGENLVEPSLGANGAGKSSIWDAVCWAIYGKTARGVSGPAVEHWGEGTRTSVTLSFTINGAPHVIERTRRPITLKLDDEEVAQDVIQELVGLTLPQFLQVGLMGQFGDMLPDMKPSQRLELLDEVLNLDVWTRAGKKASQDLKLMEERVSAADRQVAQLQAGVVSHQATLDAARAEHKDFMSKRETFVTQIKGRVEVLDKRISDVARDLQELHEDEATADHAGGSFDRALSELAKESTKLSSELARSQGEAPALKRDVEFAEERLRELKGIDAECDHCYQKVPDSWRKKLLEDHHPVLRGAKAALEKHSKLQARISRELSEVNDELDTLRKQQLAAKNKASRSRDKRRQLANKQRDLESKRADEMFELRKWSDGESILSSTALKKTRQKLDKDKKELEDALVEYYDLVTQRDLLSDWPKLYKELKLWVVDRALDELTIYVNASLVELGLKGWSITFTTHREGAKRGALEVLVASPMSPERVPWESWSGGETQRLRVACAVGMSELIRDRIPEAPVFEVWDEPTSHLNTEGVSDLVAFLAARGERKQVYIVDHRSLGSGYFSKTITVTKHEDGSRITVD